MKITHFLPLAVLTLSSGLVIPSIVLAEETTCQGTLGAVTVDNLRVPIGQTCTLRGTKVQGTIKVESNARLNASRVRVIGNIQAENAANVRVTSASTIEPI